MADEQNSNQSEFFYQRIPKQFVKRDHTHQLKAKEVNENYLPFEHRETNLPVDRSNLREDLNSQNIASSPKSTIDQRDTLGAPYRQFEELQQFKLSTNPVRFGVRTSYLKVEGDRDSSLGDDVQLAAPIDSKTGALTMNSSGNSKQDIARGITAARADAAERSYTREHRYDEPLASDRVSKQISSESYSRRIYEGKDERMARSLIDTAPYYSAAPDKKSQNQKLGPAKTTLERMKGEDLNPAYYEREKEQHRTINSSRSPSLHDEGSQESHHSNNNAAHGSSNSGIETDSQRRMGTQFGFYPFTAAHQQAGMRLAGPGGLDRSTLFRPRSGFHYGFDQRFIDASGQQQAGSPYVVSSNPGNVQQPAPPPLQSAEPNNYRFCTTDMVSSVINNAKTQYRPQMFLQPPRQLVFGAPGKPFAGHLHNTPSSDDGSIASPGSSSPYRENVNQDDSPHPDDPSKYDIKPRHKTKSESVNQCSQCGKAFSSSSALAKHKLIHSDERRYICQTCSKGFKRQDHLNGHMITHRDKKPYECRYPDCDKSYCDMRSLRRHLENHHQAPGMGDFPTSTSPPFAVQHGSMGLIASRSPYVDGPEKHGPGLSGGPIPHEHPRPASLPNSSINDSKSHPHTIRGNSDEEISPDSHTGKSDETATQRGSHGPSFGTEISADKDDEFQGRPSHFDPRNAAMYREGNIPMAQWNGTNPYMLQSYMAQRFPWASQGFAGSATNQNTLPFLMGLQQQQQRQQQQFYQQSNFHGAISAAKKDLDHKLQRPHNADTPEQQGSDDVGPHPPSSLPVYQGGGYPPGRSAVLTPEMLMQNSNPTHPFYSNAFATPTNPTAIAVAAAKTGPFYFHPRDGMFTSAHISGQQYPHFPPDQQAYQHHPSPESIPSKSQLLTPKKESNSSSGGSSPTRVPSTITSAEDMVSTQNEPISNRNNERVVPPENVFRGPPPMTPTHVRRNKPRPDPIVIPPSLNNKVCHSLSSSRPDSPSKIVMAGVYGGPPMPVYTPPAMLSPRSIFFTGSCATPRSSQAPSTPARLLHTARRLSTLEPVDESTEVVFPEPKINVGSQFQAEIPNTLAPIEQAVNDVHRASLMWSPIKEDPRKNAELQAYLELACSSALFGGSSNNEYALHILHRKRGNIKEATRLLLSRRHILRADDINGDYHYLGSTRWTAKERLAFRLAFRIKRKVFSELQKEVGTKTIPQCVEFYYLWKAVNREGFRSRTRCIEVESEQEEEESRLLLAIPPEQTDGTMSNDFTAVKPSDDRDLERYDGDSPKQGETGRIFQCDYPECRARFVSRQALNGHIRVHGGSLSKPIEAKRYNKTKPTVIITPSPGKGTDHQPTPRKRKSPSPAPRQSRPPLPPATHPDGTPMEFACKVCGRIFNKVKSRSAHMKTHVMKRNDGSGDHLKRPSVITQGVRLKVEQ